MIYKPKKEGVITLEEIDLELIAKYIHWNFFFLAWKISGNYEGIENICSCASCEMNWLQKIGVEKREKAKEALQLLKDAQEMLREIAEKKSLKAKARFSLGKVKSENEGIRFFIDKKESFYIPMLRQQKEGVEYCLSLADFVSPEMDYAGTFVVTIEGADELRAQYDKEDDTYKSLLVQTLADRLAEATTEWMHEQIRKTYWGYAEDENLSIEEILKTQYQGIRPAIGYPSLPDQSIIFTIDKILNFKELGVFITENGAMHPTASTCGLIFSHPKSSYFMIGKIGEDQLEDYARRKNVSISEAKKWLSAYL